MKHVRNRFVSLRAVLIIPIVLALAACGGESSNNDDPTPTAGINVTVETSIDEGERPTGSFSGLTQNLSINGCRVKIPLEWASIGNGVGSTASGARFTVYGGDLASDAAWETAVQLVATQANRQGATSLVRGDDWIMATLSGDRGFTFRARFENRFCDLSVSGVKPAPDSERSIWNAVAGSLDVAPPEERTPEA